MAQQYLSGLYKYLWMVRIKSQKIRMLCGIRLKHPVLLLPLLYIFPIYKSIAVCLGDSKQVRRLKPTHTRVKKCEKT